MASIVYVFLGLFVGVGLVLIFSHSAREKVVGICEVAFSRSAKKNANKEKILELLKEKDEMSNSEIREALGVSRNTVGRYLDELERESKVEQVGVVGQNVRYRLIQ
ncbi:MAG: winged helix-turn-helix domain-containing protein [Candidatus Yanofskybacteria bacterium]|nr:winged helix-turn-helix domain-containing protein [Candidatus Yanofskybacteria bacterium]